MTVGCEKLGLLILCGDLDLNLRFVIQVMLKRSFAPVHGDARVQQQVRSSRPFAACVADALSSVFGDAVFAVKLGERSPV
jgi:hypothetical protein